MIRKNPRGNYPKIHASAFIDPSAVIIGDVAIGRNVYVGPGASVRADEENSAIVINDNCNIQDRVILHALSGTKVTVGAGTSLSHGCIVHGPCRIGAHCFIGFGTVVFDSEVEDNVFVKHLAVLEKVRVPAQSLIPSKTLFTGSSRRKVVVAEKAGAELRAFSKKVVKTNGHLVKGYKSVER